MKKNMVLQGTMRIGNCSFFVFHSGLDPES